MHVSLVSAISSTVSILLAASKFSLPGSASSSILRPPSSMSSKLLLVCKGLLLTNEDEEFFSLDFLLASLVGEPPRGRGSADLRDFFMGGGKEGVAPEAAEAAAAMKAGFLSMLGKFSGAKSNMDMGGGTWSLIFANLAAKIPPAKLFEFLDFLLLMGVELRGP